MNIRNGYMSELERLLASVPEPVRREWLYDYYSHFELAAKNGQSEEEAARELGDPRTVAKELMLGYRVEQAETHGGFGTLSRAVFGTVGLGLFNIMFILGPYVAIAAVLLALWAAAAAVAIAAAAAVGDSIWIGTFTMPQALSMALVLGGFAILFAALLLKLTKLFYSGTLKYLRFNTRMIRGSRR